MVARRGAALAVARRRRLGGLVLAWARLRLSARAAALRAAAECAALRRELRLWRARAVVARALARGVQLGERWQRRLGFRAWQRGWAWTAERLLVRATSARLAGAVAAGRAALRLRDCLAGWAAWRALLASLGARHHAALARRAARQLAAALGGWRGAAQRELVSVRVSLGLRGP